MRNKMRQIGKLIVEQVGEDIELTDGVVWVMKELTPHTAATLLKDHLHPKQRRLKGRHVESLVRAQQEGRWKFLGDPIRIDRSGYIIDAQHRLRSVVLSGKTLRNVLVVVLNDDDAIEYIDTVSRPRTLPDVRHVKGQAEVRPTVMAAIVLEWCDFKEDQRNCLTKPEKNEVIEGCEYLEKISELFRIGEKRVGLTSGPLAGAVHCVKANPEAATKFFSAAFANEHSIDGVYHPMVKLFADWLIRQHTVRKSSTARHKQGAADDAVVGAEKAVRAYNAWRLGERMDKLQRGASGEVPKPVA